MKVIILPHRGILRIIFSKSFVIVMDYANNYLLQFLLQFIKGTHGIKYVALYISGSIFFCKQLHLIVFLLSMTTKQTIAQE